MEATSCPARNDRPAEALARGGVACPFCDGILVPQRESFRCPRCGFSICPGCEDPGVLDSPGAPG
jgi:hypothetical protein